MTVHFMLIFSHLCLRATQFYNLINGMKSLFIVLSPCGSLKKNLEDLNVLPLLNQSSNNFTTALK